MQMCTSNPQNSWAPVVRTPSQWIGQPICWHPSLDPQNRPNSDHREGNNNSAGLGMGLLENAENGLHNSVGELDHHHFPY